MNRHRSPFSRPVAFAVLALFLLGPARAHAQSDPPGEDEVVRVGVGYLGVGDPNSEAVLDLAYRLKDLLPGGVGLQVGGMGALGGSGSAYGYVGLARPLHLGDDFTLTPSVAAGAYRAGAGRDLGSSLEFRSGITLSRRLPGGDRITVFFYHLSNAGLGSRNPGVEVLGLGYGVFR